MDCKKFDAGETLKSGFLPKKKSDRNENFAQVMKDGFTKVTKAFKRDLKRLLTRGKNVNTRAIPTTPEVLGRVVLGNL